MDPPAIAFGNLLPYIENSDELHTAIAIWIRSHFLYRRLHVFRTKNKELKHNRISSDETDDFTIKLRMPHSPTCFMSAFFLISGARTGHETRLLASLANRCAKKTS
uniref:Uncharacterized protein n=1 Tax=Guillardia theta TaxID=55529 RepID=A0A6U5YYT5_GUITH